MNDAARALFRGLKEAEWRTLGYLDRFGPNTSTLSHQQVDILPFLKFRNGNRPNGHEQIWTLPPGKTKEEMQGIMDDVLRLTSNMMRSPGCVRYIYYLACGRRSKLEALSQEKGTPVYTFHPPTKYVPYAEMLRQVEKIFKCLAENTSLSFFDESTHSYNADTLGHTTPQFIEPFRSTAIDIFGIESRRGIPSKTAFNFKLFTNLQKLHELQRQGHDTSLQILHANFEFGVTILHESMHVIYMATWTDILAWRNRISSGSEPRDKPAKIPIEPMFQDESTPEVGRSAENYIFGGFIKSEYRNPHSAIRFFKWPSFLDGGIKPELKLLTGSGYARLATIYFVPKFFIQNIHQQAFWDNVQPHHVSALRIAKVIGIQYVNDSVDVDSDWRSSNSSEGLWPKKNENESTVVRKEKDPSAARANRPHGSWWLWGYKSIAGNS